MTKTKECPANVTPVTITTPSDVAKGQDRLQKLIKEESRLVKGRFRTFEPDGATVRIQIRKYKELPMFDMHMTDGGEYEIPLYVARHLNGVDAVAHKRNGKTGSCSYPIHGFKWDPSKPMPQSAEGAGGAPVPVVGINKTVRRFGFESLEFNTGE